MTNDDKATDKPVDLTGRDRLVWNSIVSWGSQFVVIIAGFALPRLMHESLGQTVLGIWDFAWAFVHYFSLMNLGIGSSVNRFVAKYRAEEEYDALNAAVSTVVLIQIIVTLIVVAASFGVAAYLAHGYRDSLGADLESTQIIVIMLGMSAALEMLANPGRGVLTGYHRWDLHGGLAAASAVLSLVLMSGVLLAGGDIIAVSIVYFVAIAITEGTRVWLGFAIGREIRLSLALCSMSHAREQLRFGGKTLLVAVPHVALIQTVNLITVSFLGPAALAVFARPFALIRQLYTLMYKFTMMLTPTAGSLEAVDQSELSRFFVGTLRMNFALTVPAIAFFVIFGDLILLVWMGPEYRNWTLVGVLALGHLLAIGQDGSIRILQGLDRHGRLSIYLFFTVGLTGLGTYLYLRDAPWTLLSSAITLAVPMTVAFGMLAPAFACYVLRIRPFEYIGRVLLFPIVINGPFIGGLMASRYYFQAEDWIAAGALLAASGLIEAFVYFRFLIPREGRQRLLKMVRLA